jgi:type IV pilus assembly protein PilZ
MKSHCPYCTKEISGDDIDCPECAAAFGEETLLVTKGLVEEALKGVDEVQRRHDRIPKKFRISYSSPEAFTKSYLVNIGKGGVFIKTTKPLKKGEKTSLRMLLPDGGKELEVTGEVIWSSEKKHRTPIGEYPPGMGVKFANLSAEDKERIDSVLRQSTT